MKYKAVGFDYGGVIGGLALDGSDFVAEVAAILGVKKEDIAEDYLGLNSKINCGELKTWHEFWHLFLEHLNRLDALEPVTQLSNDFAKRLNVVDVQMLQLVDKLKDSGLKVGLLSNTSIERGEEMRELKIDTHFDAFLISAEIKMMKPNSESFTHLANQLGVKTNELVFVDDSKHSLSRSKESGFKPILFKNHDQLVEELRQLGIINT